jgi:hypothetical protein
MLRASLVLALAGCWTGGGATTTTVENTKREPMRQSESLLGTVWRGPDVDGEMTFRFRPNGKLNYTNANGTWDNGRWSQKGHRVFVDMNNHYADYDGAFVGDAMSGGGHNVTGKRWTWSFQRVR